MSQNQDSILLPGKHRNDTQCLGNPSVLPRTNHTTTSIVVQPAAETAHLMISIGHGPRNSSILNLKRRATRLKHNPALHRSKGRSPRGGLPAAMAARTAAGGAWARPAQLKLLSKFIQHVEHEKHMLLQVSARLYSGLRPSTPPGGSPGSPKGGAEAAPAHALESLTELPWMSRVTWRRRRRRILQASRGNPVQLSQACVRWAVWQ